MVTNFRKVATYDNGNPPMKSYDSLITWSREAMWQIENVISPLPQYNQNLVPHSFSHDPLISYTCGNLIIWYLNFHIPSVMKIRVVNLFDLKFTKKLFVNHFVGYF